MVVHPHNILTPVTPFISTTSAAGTQLIWWLHSVQHISYYKAWKKTRQLLEILLKYVLFLLHNL